MCLRRLTAAVLFAASAAAAQPLPGGGAGPGSEPPGNLVSLSSCMPIAPSSTTFMSPGSCVETGAGLVAMPLARAGGFAHFACTTSKPTGAGVNVIVRARAGPCGGTVAVVGFTCTIPGANLTPGVCATNPADRLLVGGKACFTFEIITPSGLPPDVRVNCTMERQ